MSKTRKRAEIDLMELEKLAHLQCTDAEIAAWFGTTADAVEKRRQDPAFAEIMARGKGKGRISVRRMQMKMLEQGNATMGVWLGKQILGQTDQVVHEIHGHQQYNIRPIFDSISVAKPAGRLTPSVLKPPARPSNVHWRISIARRCRGTHI